MNVGPNKPFKDLAWGLASRGIAVVRFDKVTHAHAHIEHEPGFTMVEEYLPNALAAVRLLRQHPGIDPARVFVAGHSGGGKAAVRVAASEPSIAGVVMLAADTVPLPRAAARIFSYVAGLDPTADTAAALAGTAETIARTEDPALCRLAWLLADLPVELVGRVRSDRVFCFPPQARPPAASRPGVRPGRAGHPSRARSGHQHRDHPLRRRGRCGLVAAAPSARAFRPLGRSPRRAATGPGQRDPVEGRSATR